MPNTNVTAPRRSSVITPELQEQARRIAAAAPPLTPRQRHIIHLAAMTAHAQAAHPDAA